MHPIVSAQLAELRTEEFRREATQARLTHARGSQVRGTSNVRANLGQLLIRMGQRIEPAPVLPATRLA